MNKRTATVVVVIIIVAAIALGIAHWIRSARNEAAMERIRAEHAAEMEKAVRSRAEIDSLDRVVREAREVEEQLKRVADSLGVSYEQALLWRHAILNRPRSRSAAALRDSILRASGQHHH